MTGLRENPKGLRLNGGIDRAGVKPSGMLRRKETPKEENGS